VSIAVFGSVLLFTPVKLFDEKFIYPYLLAMEDFLKIKKVCEENTAFTVEVLDKFLLYYAAEKDKLSKEADQRLHVFRHITRKFGNEWLSMLKSQYIIHRVMKKGGLINKYLKHAAIKNLDQNSRDWMVSQAETPWRFSFAVVKDQPENDFYQMEDVFSGEEYLLYSPSIKDIINKDGRKELWFNLIGFNGVCWQTYGPLAGYTSFGPDDIFFFATELNPLIEDESDLAKDVDRNPVPYMMLFLGSTQPLIEHEGEALVMVITEEKCTIPKIQELETSFNLSYTGGVYRLGLKDWESSPHFSVAYFNEKKHIIQATALTEKGFERLIETLNKYDVKIDKLADIYLRPSMHTTAEEVLKRKIELMPLELLFESENEEELDEELKKLNDLIERAIPVVNAGEEPDLEAMAAKLDLDYDNNRETMEKIISDLKNKAKKTTR
jgi:hypothetical protein